MLDQTCECCGAIEPDAAKNGTAIESDPAADRWLGETAPMETPLPDDVRTAMERFTGEGSIATLADWVEALRGAVGGSLAVEDLCHAEEETSHWGELNGSRYDFRCFYDAVALAELASDPVAVHTESPDGTAIEARATGDGDLQTQPSTAAVSFGIVPDEIPTDGSSTLEDAYAAICPSVKAFPSRDAYDRWAARTSAVTVGLPLAAATEVATALVE